MSKEQEKPTYEFAEVPDGTLNPISPIKKQVAKTMVVTENFTIFDVLAYIGKMKKAIDDKRAEIEGLEAMVKAYEDELKVIEDQLGVQKLEEEYQKTLAEDQSESPDGENVSGDQEVSS